MSQSPGHFRHNWTKRFFTLRHGILSYFGQMGDRYPPAGADLKGMIELRYYSHAEVDDVSPCLITLASHVEGYKDYLFRHSSSAEAARFTEKVNKHIAWIKEEDRKDTAVRSTVAGGV